MIGYNYESLLLFTGVALKTLTIKGDKQAKKGINIKQVRIKRKLAILSFVTYVYNFSHSIVLILAAAFGFHRKIKSSLLQQSCCLIISNYLLLIAVEHCRLKHIKCKFRNC